MSGGRDQHPQETEVTNEVDVEDLDVQSLLKELVLEARLIRKHLELINNGEI